MTEKKTSEQLYGELFSRVRLASGESMQETQALLTNFANAVRAEAAAELHKTADAAYLRDVKEASEARREAIEARRVFWLHQDANAALNGFVMREGDQIPPDQVAQYAFKVAKAMRAEFEKVQIEERKR